MRDWSGWDTKNSTVKTLKENNPANFVLASAATRKIPYTGWDKQQTFISLSPRAGMSEIAVSADLAPGKSALPGRLPTQLREAEL